MHTWAVYSLWLDVLRTILFNTSFKSNLYFGCTMKMHSFFKINFIKIFIFSFFILTLKMKKKKQHFLHSIQRSLWQSCLLFISTETKSTENTIKLLERTSSQLQNYFSTRSTLSVIDFCQIISSDQKRNIFLSW